MTVDWRQATTVADLLRLRREATPHGVAFRHEQAPGRWENISWDEFARRVDELQRGLNAAGLRRGDRLVLVLPASLQWELLHHAALGIGVAVIGLDTHDLPERLVLMAAQAQAVAFAVTDATLWQRLQRAGASAPLVVAATGPVTASSGVMGIDALLSLPPGHAGHAPEAAPRQPAPDDMATIIFTSGTTGAPKGIAYSHAQICMAVNAIAEAFSFAGSGSQMLCWLPLSNLFQRVVNLTALRQGAVTTLLSDPRRVMDVVADVSPDVFIGVPRFYEKLHHGIRSSIATQPVWRRVPALAAWRIGRRARRLQRQGQPVPPLLALAHRAADVLILRRIRAAMGTRLRCMVSGSAPISRHLLEEFDALGWIVLEAYGLSENVMPMALNRLDEFRFGSVGRPLSGNEVRLGNGGEVLVRGPGVFSGYLGEQPGERLDAEGWYATGDLGRFDPDGLLHLTGRNSDLIKTSAGRRVAPAGVEAQLQRVEGIEQAMLLGAGRKCLAALCTVSHPALLAGAGRAVLEQALSAEVARINPHERPIGVALLSQPFSIETGELTPNLKLRRSAIEARHAEVLDRLYMRIGDCAGAGARTGLIVV